MRFSVSYTFAMEEIKFGELKLVIVLLIAVNLRRSRRNMPIIVCRGEPLHQRLHASRRNIDYINLLLFDVWNWGTSCLAMRPI